MIAARIALGAERCELRISGHAGFAPRGQDIVCAAVSGLVYALAGGLQALGERPEIRLAAGEGRILCAGGEAVRAMFRMAASGLEQLAETYPAHVALYLEAAGEK